MDHSTTGDGLISALLVLAHLVDSGPHARRASRDAPRTAGARKTCASKIACR